MCSADNFCRLVATWYLQTCCKPDDLVPLCKYLQFTDSENHQFLKKWMMIIIWHLHSGTKLSGWLRHRLQLIFADLLQLDICRLVATRYLQTCCNSISAGLLQLDICRLVATLYLQICCTRYLQICCTRYLQTCCNSVFADLLQLDICRLVATWYLQTCCNSVFADLLHSVFADLLQLDICRLVATWYLQTCCNSVFADLLHSVFADLLQLGICRLVATWYLQTCCNSIFADLLQLDICRLFASCWNDLHKVVDKSFSGCEACSSLVATWAFPVMHNVSRMHGKAILWIFLQLLLSITLL